MRSETVCSAIYHVLQVLTTAPMVPYRLHTRGGAVADLESPLDFPKENKQNVEGVEEPTVDCTILVPEAHTGAVLRLCSGRRGDLLVRSCSVPALTSSVLSDPVYPSTIQAVLRMPHIRRWGTS